MFENLFGKKKKKNTEPDKNRFYAETKELFELGLLKELTSNDYICICNVGNQGYAVFNYQNLGNGQIGMFVSKTHVPNLAWVDEKGIPVVYLDYIQRLNDKLATERSFQLDQETIKRLFELQKQGPSGEIDLQMEEELINKGKNK